MSGDQSTGDSNSGSFHIRREALRDGIGDEEVAAMCELRTIAGAVECGREGKFLVTKWPMHQARHAKQPK